MAGRSPGHGRKWSAIYYENTGIRPKPILIVNAFKDTPLNDRVEAAFPHQMVDYSTRREHCLITTLQLFTLYQDGVNNKIDKAAMINSLFETVGEYKMSNSWTDYITKG